MVDEYKLRINELKEKYALLGIQDSSGSTSNGFDKVLKLHVLEDVRIKQEIFEDDILHFFNENEKTNVLLQEK